MRVRFLVCMDLPEGMPHREIRDAILNGIKDEASYRKPSDPFHSLNKETLTVEMVGLGG